MTTDYKKSVEEAVKKVLGYIDLKDGWKVIKQTGDVTISSRPSPEFDGLLYKAEGELPASPEVLFYQYVYPENISDRLKWDNALSYLETVETITPNIRVVNTRTHSALMGLVSARDFVNVVLTKKTNDLIYNGAISVEHPKCPIPDGHVRGKNYSTGFFCYSVPEYPNRSRVVSFTHVDLGGMLPKPILNQALPGNLVDFFNNLRETLNQKNKA